MAQADRYLGTDLVLVWTKSGGSAFPLEPDYRSVTERGNVNKVDASAGADAHAFYLRALKDGTVSATVLDRTGGTLFAQLEEGTLGSLEIGFAGDASGKEKRTIACFIESCERTAEYNGLVTWNVTFQRQASATTGTYT